MILGRLPVCEIRVDEAAQRHGGSVGPDPGRAGGGGGGVDRGTQGCGLGAAGAKMIIAEATYEVSDPTVDSQILTLQGSGADALMGELLVNAACVRLAKRCAVSKLNVVPCRGGLPAARLKRVLEYIDANLGKHITLSELALETFFPADAATAAMLGKAH